MTAEDVMAEVAVLVLAAGRGTRFGAGPHSSKLLAMLGGRPLVGHVVAAALASRAATIVVVTGPAAEHVTAALRGMGPVAIVHNPDYAIGIASSLKSGLAALPPSAEGAIIMLGDMPFVTSGTLDRLIGAFDPSTQDAVIPNYDGRHGNPVLIGRRFFPQIAALSGDEGARSILRDRSCRAVECAVDDPGVLVDIDTRSELAARGPALN